MKENTIYVTVINSEDSFYGSSRERLFINDKHMLSVNPLCECPEDAIIERDLVSCSDIMDYMEKVCKWIKEGKEVIFYFENVDDVWDFDIKEYLKSL